MPTYEYACTQCGQHLEVVQSMSDAPLTTCGACGGRLRKVFAPIGIVFKGSGFYRTDSRSKAGAGTAGDSGGAGGSSDAGGKRADKAGSPSGSSKGGASSSPKAGEKSA